MPESVYLAPHLPGEEAARVSNLVICDGGSAATQQALVHGVPVLGLSGNLDQYLITQTYGQAGVGRLLCAASTDTAELAKVIAEIVGDASYTEAAGELSRKFEKYSDLSEFHTTINEISVNSKVRR